MGKQLKTMTQDFTSSLRIDTQKDPEFSYYTSDSLNSENWSVLGIKYRSKDPWVVELQLMAIEIEALAYPGFSANSDAPGYFAVTPDTYVELLTFLENQILQEKVVDQGEVLPHFVPVTRDELLQFHHPHSLLEEGLRSYYWYTLDSLKKDEQSVRYMVCFPHWSFNRRKNQLESLWFIALGESQLRDPNFHLLDDSDGLGLILFTRSELRDLLIMMKRRDFYLHASDR